MRSHRHGECDEDDQTMNCAVAQADRFTLVRLNYNLHDGSDTKTVERKQ